MDVQTTGDSDTVLKWPDYIIIGTLLMISAGIGVYYRFTGGKQQTTQEYFTADRSMGVVPLAIALMVSFKSSISLLGMSAENYIYGSLLMVMYVGAGIATVLTMYMYIPVFFELKCMSAYEYLEKRFGQTARLAASTANFMNLMLYTGVVVYAPSLALEATTGLSGTMSLILIGTICTFYSTIGGIKAVLVTDVFQGILMFICLLCVVGVASHDLDGGFISILRISYEGGRLDFSNFSLDPTERLTWWNLSLGAIVIFLSLYGVSQVQVQRLLTVKSLREARISLVLNYILLVAIGLITTLAGLSMYAVYKDCDPIASGQIDTDDKLMPFFAAHKLSRFPGLTGLFVAGIFSASLSTISAMLNSLAAVALEDYVKPFYKRIGTPFPDDKALLIGKAIALCNGFLCLAIAFMAQGLGTLVEMAIGVIGNIGGPLLGIFTLGMFFESANEVGAVSGLVSALIFGGVLTFGHKPHAERLPTSVAGCDNATLVMMSAMNTTKSQSEDPSTYFFLFRISRWWFPFMCTTVVLLVGLVISFLVNKFSTAERRELDPSLFVPMVAARIRRRREDVGKTTSSQVFVLEHSPRK